MGKELRLADLCDTWSVRTQGRGAQTKARVLAAALPLFAEAGDQARIDDLSTASGVSVGSIYHHFGSREGVVNAVYAEQLSALVQALAEATTAMDDLKDGVRVFVDTYIGWITEHPEAATFIYGIGHFPKYEDTASVAAVSKSDAITSLTRWFDAFAQAGEVGVTDPIIVELVLLGPVREYCQRFLAGTVSEPPDVVGPQLAEAAWRALRA